MTQKRRAPLTNCSAITGWRKLRTISSIGGMGGGGGGGGGSTSSFALHEPPKNIVNKINVKIDSTWIVSHNFARVLISWAVDSEGSEETNRDNFDSFVFCVAFVAVEEPLEMRLRPIVDWIELDHALEFDVLGSILDIDLVFDLGTEIAWGEAVNDQVGSDLATEAAAVVLADIVVLDIVDDQGASTTLLDNLVLVSDVGLVENCFSGGIDTLPGNNSGMLGQVGVEHNSVALAHPGVAKVFDESNRGDTINAQISGRSVAIVAADAVNNAGTALINVVNDEHPFGANRDDVELTNRLDFGLLPISEIPIDFGFHILNFSEEECPLTRLHPLILQFEFEWNTSLEFQSGFSSFIFECF